MDILIYGLGAVANQSTHIGLQTKDHSLNAGAKAPTIYQVFSALMKSAIAFKAFLLALVSDSASASPKPNASAM